jgi:arylsulfatase A-like enzyme
MLLAILTQPASFVRAAEKPKNIVLIYADDIGYGDLSCYGATKVATPNIDRLAARGLRFTDGHAMAATCTPSRYSLLTGEYAFRNKRAQILPGDASLIIDPKRTTMAFMLHRAGYTTAAIGKWHLGLGSGKIDWNSEIKPGPRELGFDESFIIPATGDRTPCVFVEYGHVAGLDPNDPIEVSYGKPVGDEPTGLEHPEMLKMKLSAGHDKTIINGISRIGYMAGGKRARWKDEEIADTLTARAVEFIEQHKDRSMFLFFASHDIHVPRVPHPRFVGKSDCGTRGDAIVQFDWCVGEILNALEQHGLTDNTLVILTSDNGPVLDDGYADGAVKDLNGHRPAGPLRGGKVSIYEGGTRVPFIASWPKQIKPGVSGALMSQVDLTASLAAIVESPLADKDRADGQDCSAALVGKSPSGREVLIEQAGNSLAVRKGNWKFVPAGAPRGQPNNEFDALRSMYLGKTSEDELYNLADDRAEQRNLAAKHPEIVGDMKALAFTILDSKRP